MNTAFKNFLKDHKLFGLLNESLARSWSMTKTAKSIKDLAVQQKALELVARLRIKAIQYHQNQEIDINDIDESASADKVLRDRYKGEKK